MLKNLMPAGSFSRSFCFFGVKSLIPRLTLGLQVSAQNCVKPGIASIPPEVSGADSIVTFKGSVPEKTGMQ
jgi:hypothetical protein